jgi:endonuclease YncB( thermonuclease family)
MVVRFLISLAVLASCLLLIGAEPRFNRASAAQTPQVQVTDGDSLILGGTKMRLTGIDAPELQQTCGTANGKRWPCGQQAKAALQALVSSDPAMVCVGSSHDRYGRLLVTCHGEFGDLGHAMVSQGMAWAYRKYSLDHVGAEGDAQRRGIGIWQGDTQRPDAFRAAQTDTPAQTDPSDLQTCRIKGNISGKDRIYHLPGQAFYAQTRISAARGERWFCSEAEARAAGWRKAG